MVTVFERRAMPLDNEFDLDTTWNRSRAYTVDYETYNRLFDRGKLEIENDKQDEKERNTSYLVVDSYCEIEEFDRVSESAPVTRPRILVILGMICLATGIPLTPFDFSSIFSNVTDPNGNVGEHPSKLIIDEVDLSDRLSELLSAMNALPEVKRPLVFSLLDRWRKAAYLDLDNEESFLYEDEALLACFHILEMLADEYKNILDEELAEKIKAFTTDVLETSLFIKDGQKQSDMIKLINNSLEAYKTIKPKILRMMRELNMLEPKSKALIERFLNHRNGIAHGRTSLYEDKVIYPLKPFFAHMKDIYEDIFIIRITTARLIAAYLGISLWEDEWKNLIEEELATYEDVQNFNRDFTYEGLTCDQFEEGTESGVSVWTLIHYYRKGTLKFQPFSMALAKYIHEVELSEQNETLVLYSAAILADSSNELIAERSRALLIELKDSQFQARFEMRDILKELSYQGKEPLWLKEFLIERAQAGRPAKTPQPDDKE